MSLFEHTQQPTKKQIKQSKKKNKHKTTQMDI